MPAEGPDASQVPDEVEVAVVGAPPARPGSRQRRCWRGTGSAWPCLTRPPVPRNTRARPLVHARTLEVLGPLGVVDEALHEGVIVPHFGVRDRDRRLLAVDFDGLPTPHPYALMLPQDDTEGLLRRALRRRGAEIAWGREVVRGAPGRGRRRAHDPSTAGRTAGEGKTRARLRRRAQFGAGRDGDTLRGRDVPPVVRARGRAHGGALPDDEVQLFFSQRVSSWWPRCPGGRHRVVATVDEAPAEPSLNDVQALLDARGPRTLRTRVEEVVWSSRFRVAHKVAARFREGNVFLCGDAAHVHSPAGGQGMNTGIQDAANLAWKLALVLRGHADEGAAGVLLDSYEAERRQVALGVVSTTHRLTRLATVRSPVARHLKMLLLAVAGLGGRLPRRLAANLAEVDIVYRGGWSADGSRYRGERCPDTRRREDGGGRTGPRLGTRVPAPGPRGPRKPRFSTPPRVFRASRSASCQSPASPRASPARPDGYVAGRSGAEDSTRLPSPRSGARGDPPSPRPRRRCGRKIRGGRRTPSFGASEHEQELLPWGSSSESWGRGVRFGCAHIGRGRCTWFATRNVPEGGTGRSARRARRSQGDPP